MEKWKKKSKLTTSWKWWQWGCFVKEKIITFTILWYLPFCSSIRSHHTQKDSSPLAVIILCFLQIFFQLLVEKKTKLILSKILVQTKAAPRCLPFFFCVIHGLLFPLTIYIHLYIGAIPFPLLLEWLCPHEGRVYGERILLFKSQSTQESARSI